VASCNKKLKRLKKERIAMIRISSLIALLCMACLVGAAPLDQAAKSSQASAGWSSGG